MKLLLLCLFIILGAFAFAGSSLDPNIELAMLQMLAGNGNNEGAVTIANYTENTLDLLKPLNRQREKEGKEIIRVKWGEKIVVISGKPAQDMKRLYQQEMGERNDFTENLEEKFLVFTGNVAKFFEEIIKKHFEFSKNLIVKKELGLVIGNITYGLTMQLVKEMILRRIGLHAALLFPLTAVIDLIPVIIGTAAALITTPILGGVLLLEVAAWGLVKIVTVTVHGIIKVGKWIISKIKAIFKKPTFNKEELYNVNFNTWDWELFFQGAEAGKSYFLEGTSITASLEAVKGENRSPEFIQGLEQGYLKLAYGF